MTTSAIELRGRRLLFLFFCLLWVLPVSASHAAQLDLDKNFLYINESLVISGSGFWGSEDVIITEAYFSDSATVASLTRQQSVVAELDGSIIAGVDYANSVGGTVVLTARGQSSGYSASTSAAASNVIISIINEPSDLVCFDSLTGASSVDICAELLQICPDGTTAPLPGRELKFQLNHGDCNIDFNEDLNGEGFTDQDGLACITLAGVDQLYLGGSIGYRARFSGELAPDESSPANSACEEDIRTNLSAVSDCFILTIIDSCISDDIGLVYEVTPIGDADVYFVETVDIDRDNHTDVIYTGNTVDGLFIAYGQPGAGLDAPISYLPIKQASIHADFINSDTLQDLVAVTLSKIYTFINLGNRQFAIDSVPLFSPDYPVESGTPARALIAPSFAEGYFDGDIFIDLAIAPDKVWLGSSDGSYSSFVSLPYQFETVNSCDFNNDGHDDLIITTGDSTRILVNDGLGTFTQSSVTFTGAVKVDLAASNTVVDLNDDFNCDFAQVVPLQNVADKSMVTIAIGNGDGTIRKYDTIPIDGLAYSITTADVDHDNDLELIVANGSTQRLLVYYNDGFDNFDSSDFIDLQIANELTFALASFDLNRDGYFDFVSGALGGGGLVLAVEPEAADSSLTDEMSVTAFDDATVRVSNPDGFVISEDVSTVAGSEFQTLDLDGDGSLDDRTLDYNLQLGEYTITLDIEPDSPDPAPLTSAAIGINGSQQAVIYLQYDATGALKNSGRAPVDSITFYYTVELVSSIQPENGIPQGLSRPTFDWSLQTTGLPPGTVYEFQLDKYHTFPAPRFDVTGLTTPQYRPDSSLGNDSVFYWRYRYDDGSGVWSEYSREFAVYVTGLCCFGNTGNIDGDPTGSLDMSDVTFLVSYLFLNGPYPPCPDASDVNGDPVTNINIEDLTYLVRYIFHLGDAPAQCP